MLLDECKGEGHAMCSEYDPEHGACDCWCHLDRVLQMPGRVTRATMDNPNERRM